jgi:hypothetical protein
VQQRCLSGGEKDKVVERVVVESACYWLTSGEVLHSRAP